MKNITRIARITNARDAGRHLTMAGRLFTLAGKVRTMTGRHHTLAGGQYTLAGKLHTLAGRQRTLAGKVCTIAGKLHTIAGKLRTVAGRQRTMAGRLTVQRFGPNTGWQSVVNKPGRYFSRIILPCIVIQLINFYYDTKTNGTDKHVPCSSNRFQSFYRIC